MSSPFRTPLSATMIVSGAVVGLTSIALWTYSAAVTDGLLDSDLRLVALAVGGLALELAGMAVHDRGHRQRGERPHALRGLDDRHRPGWLPRRRR